jgi:hypothetical protein
VTDYSRALMHQTGQQREIPVAATERTD